MSPPFSRFHRIMHHLALTAMVLMLCMPVLGRWHQVHIHQAQAETDMCLSEASRAALDGHAHHHPQDDANTPAHDHLNHDACGYCTLATRMLPVLALVLALPPLPPAQHSPHSCVSAPPTTSDWPAHPPRGPPHRS